MFRQVATVSRAMGEDHMVVRAVALLAQRAIDPREFLIVADQIGDARNGMSPTKPITKQLWPV